MSRINTNPSSMIAQANLAKNNRNLNTTLERLSTGLRINRGKDDPAGLIASENLRAEKTGLTSAISNAERADQIANIAEGGLQEVSNLLTDLKGLITATANGAGLSTEEKQANQLQIDSILQTVDRISDSTNFQGVKLLNGNLDFTTSSVSANVSDFRVNGAKLNAGTTMAVTATVTTSAQRGAMLLDFNAAGIVTTSAGKLFTIEVAGANGSREFSFSNGTTVAQAVTAINSFKDVLGISAAGVSTSGIDLRSTDFGSDQFVATKIIENAGVVGANVVQGGATAAYTYTGTSTAIANNATVRDTGQDVGGTINGILGTGKGRTLQIASDFLDTSITLTAGTAGNTGNTSAFTITGGGASFQLSSKVDIGGKTALGIQSVAARKLGRTEVTSGSPATTNSRFLADLASGKALNVVSGDLTSASKVVDEAIRQVSGLRGRLGAFQKNTIGSTISSLNVSLENSSAAESVIRDADFANETASLTRGQILAQAAANSLSLSNSQPQQALSLLRG